jgi:Neuraminidase (sialidase)
MTSVEYIETVKVGDEKVPCARFLLLVPLADCADLNAADRGSPTGVSPTLARTVAVPVAAETQAAVAAGRLVLRA